MQSDSIKREFFTSLVGTVPLADVLADLPLPTPLPTPLEETVLGRKPVSQEARKVLDSTNPVHCSRIAEALLAVDTSFLSLKDAAQTVPFTPSMKDPPLIRAVMAKLHSQPVGKLQKMDPGLYPGPATNSSSTTLSSNEQSSADAVVPDTLHTVSDVAVSRPPQTKRRDRKKPSSLIPDSDSTLTSKSRKGRRISSSSDETSPPRRKRQKLAERDPDYTSESLRVSIGRLSNQPEPPKHKRRHPGPKTLGQPSRATSVLSPLRVQFPRAKLAGSFGLSYSREVHVLQTGEALSLGGAESRTDMVTVSMGGEGWTQQDMEFAMAPGVADTQSSKEH